MTFTFDGFDPANTTPVPDVFFDVLLPHMNEAQLKIMLYIIRRTLGFKKTEDAISLKQFRFGIVTKEKKRLDNGCGLKNFTTISKAIKSLEQMNCIERAPAKTADGDDATTIYRIRFRGTTRNVVPTTDIVVGVLRQTEDGTTPNGGRVLRQTEPQETVIQDTDSQETVIQEGTVASFGNDAAPENVVDFETTAKRITNSRLKAVKPYDMLASNPIIHTHNPYHGLDPYPFGYRSDLIDADPINQEAWRKALQAKEEGVNLSDSRQAIGNDDAITPILHPGSKSVADEGEDEPTQKMPAVNPSKQTSSLAEPVVEGPQVPAASSPPTSTQQAAPGNHLPSTGKRSRGKKSVAVEDVPAPTPKSDTREIQRRINEHRGYALEEKVQIIRERQAIKTWCNLHEIGDYDLVMARLKKDPYWGKTENYYRIDGVTLLRETPKALGQRPLKAAANGDVAPQDDDYSDFDRYVGNGKEERAKMRELYKVMEANGELI